MRVVGDYAANGYALVEQLISREVANAFLRSLKQDLGDAAIPLSSLDTQVNLLKRPAFELYSHHYKPMNTFLWGLTPAIVAIVGKPLLPTYDYFRLYREGDVCRVHFDRPSCEHSVSLTLDYSDGASWPLDVGQRRHEQPNATVAEDFGDEPFASLDMTVGDAVIYRGTKHRHGRIRPNPNGWSAHLFLHWVDPTGPYADHGFDGQAASGPVDFKFS